MVRVILADRFLQIRNAARRVYLVKLSSRARTAACLILSGVGKSGSPAPKATTSTPEAFKRPASAVTAMVADSLIPLTLCVSSILI